MNAAIDVGAKTTCINQGSGYVFVTLAGHACNGRMAVYYAVAVVLGQEVESVFFAGGIGIGESSAFSEAV